MRPQTKAAARVAVRTDDKARSTRLTLLSLAAASAVVLCTLAIGHADTWVTVNPDGSVTRTHALASTTQAHSQIRSDGTYNAVQTPVSPSSIIGQGVQPNVQFGSGTTTIFSGTHYPVPNYYTYPVPGGHTYPIGPQVPGFYPPTVTTLPSTGVGYGYPAYGYPAYGFPSHGGCGHVQPGCNHYPVYSNPYPLYGTSGVYYSGPAGGGGTIYSSSTTNNRGYGVSLGNGGWRVNGGNRTRSTSSTTTVTTSR